LAFLFTAGAVRLTWPPEPPLTGRRFVLLLALAAALALTKITYGLLAFLVLGLCARSGPGATADKWRGVATLIGAGAAAAVWAGYAQSIYLDYAHYHPAFRDGQALIPGADPAAQWRHLRAAPGDFLAAVWALRGAFGTVYSTFGSLGWDMAASWQIGGMIPIGILLLALWDGNARWPIAWWQRLLALVVAGAVISAIFLVCYLQWTVVGARNIAGLQGRYFLPLLPALLLALARPGRELPLKARRIIPLFWLGMVALTAAVIARRYYAPV
jgi:hypothetical protein